MPATAERMVAQAQNYVAGIVGSANADKNRTRLNSECKNAQLKFTSGVEPIICSS